MKLNQIAAALMVTLGCLAFTQAKTEVKKETSKETTINKIEGSVKWTGYGVGDSHSGTITVKSGEVTMGNKDQVLSAQFVLDMKTLATADSKKLEGHLKSADFFDVEKFTEANFKSTKIESVLNDKKDMKANYKIYGDLTIKDKTQPIDFMLAVSKKDGKFVATANTEIADRTKYGINYHSAKFETVSKLGDKLIKDNIKLDIEIKTK